MVRTMVAAVLLAAGMTGSLAAGPWLEDWETAKKESAASGKPILVDVTGSDWCQPCQIMEAEIFSQPDFLPLAQAQYVLVRIDFPRKTAQAERVRAQNQRWAEAYPFSGFPTTYLVDAKGIAFGKHTGLVSGGVAGYFTLLAGMGKQKAALEALSVAVTKAAPGASRAQAQDALFRQAEAWGLEFVYGDLPRKIVQEDSDGKAGLKARYQVYNAYHRALATWSDRPDFRMAVEDFTQLAVRAQAWPDLQQQILFTKGMVLLNALDDELGAREAFRQSRALGPETIMGQRAAELLDKLP